MGKIERPIRRQIISSFFLILLFSIIATIFTWAIIATLFMLHSNRINPANYYEKQIPTILQYIEQSNAQILQKDQKKDLEEMIPLEGMDYQVLNKNGTILYGSTSKQYIKSQKDLLNSFNTNLYDKNDIVQFYPIFNRKNEQIGAIGFRYSLNLASSNPQLSWLIFSLGLLAFASPFIYFSLFSYLIGRSFSKQIEGPFNHLMEGARKIQSHDLDFQLMESKTSKELNELVRSFEDMRISLKASLLRQWQLEEERKEMVAAIAHDLRTPLTIIHGHVEGLMDGGVKNPERLDRYLKTIFSSTQRSIRLIDQLNEASAIGRQIFIMEPKVVNTAEFIQHKAEEYKMLCAKKNITLKKSFILSDEAEMKINMDPYRVSQVLDNIITNSIRYCPKDGVIEWIITKEHDKVIFEIRDNGPGFQQEETGRVFKKFYRGDASRSGEDSNFGLGLYIAQMIVKKHHGAITVQNHAQGGAYTKIIFKALVEVKP
ncbi:sensor histidine kinase [Lederbergia lenta]|uniref:sensor histidine kinase n=1 Tax=Lederbergia lenta TaxID=1467 RepID=UPI00203AB794|nr:HAMP domain-containing sensor histidine kinase [Lederbergia lenta]MCM3112591.1 HAMP domain-containing histidine kinase [Lederbergia lenta]